CDPEFIRGVLSDGCFDLKDRIDAKIGAGYSEYYNMLIGSVQNHGDRVSRYRAQLITYEYCKASETNARDKVDRFDLFEAKWFFAR
ncbi:MAG: hypothetical protein ACI3V0_04275, partial [Faecousia sp.]